MTRQANGAFASVQNLPRGCGTHALLSRSNFLLQFTFCSNVLWGNSHCLRIDEDLSRLQSAFANFPK